MLTASISRPLTMLEARFVGFRWFRVVFALLLSVAIVWMMVENHAVWRRSILGISLATAVVGGVVENRGVERLAVEREVPVLRDLEALTHAPSLVARSAKGLCILIAGIIDEERASRGTTSV